jgi:hypothetical protein
MSVQEILSIVGSFLDRLGITPYINAALIVVVAVMVIGLIYARFNKS